jgi:hypothetical protein
MLKALRSTLCSGSPNRALRLKGGIETACFHESSGNLYRSSKDRLKGITRCKTDGWLCSNYRKCVAEQIELTQRWHIASTIVQCRSFSTSSCNLRTLSH